MAIPFEMVSGPVTLYVADAGTATPDIATTVATPWTLIGSSLSEDGLVVNIDATYERQRTLDSPRTKKFFLTEEDIDMTVTLLDLTVETFARVMNGAAVTTQAAGSGTGGYREFVLGRDFDIRLFAVLVRGYSPYGDGFNAHYWLPRCLLQGMGPSYVKGEAAGLEVNIMPVDDTATGGYGIYRSQNVVAGS